jgi:hypothetical protein
MRIYQSRLNGELFLAYEVFRQVRHKSEVHRALIMIEDVFVGVLIECRTGYMGIFKSFEVLDRQCEFIGEL